MKLTQTPSSEYLLGEPTIPFRWPAERRHTLVKWNSGAAHCPNVDKKAAPNLFLNPGIARLRLAVGLQLVAGPEQAACDEAEIDFAPHRVVAVA